MSTVEKTVLTNEPHLALAHDPFAERRRRGSATARLLICGPQKKLCSACPRHVFLRRANPLAHYEIIGPGSGWATDERRAPQR